MGKDKLLSRIHKNAEAGVYTIPVVAAMANSGDFKRSLKLQQAEYKNVYHAAERLTNSTKLMDLSGFAKKRTEAMIKLSAISDKSTSHFAEMMIMGSTRGVIDLKKALKKYPDAPAASKNLAETLLLVEEKNIERLKKYL